MDAEQRSQWNEGHKKLSNIILNPAEHENAIKLFLQQHAWLHSSNMDRTQSLSTLEDDLFNGAEEETLRKYPVSMQDTRNSIVWHLWHIARIEDMTMNVLVSNNEQVLYAGDWCRHLNIDFVHSGNGMSEEEIANLSAQIDIPALKAYRLEVGKRTRDILSSLSAHQLKQKVDPQKIKKLVVQGAVKPAEKWLLEYWGKKTLAGLVLMPATRHNFVHLNKSLRIKHKLQK